MNINYLLPVGLALFVVALSFEMTFGMRMGIGIIVSAIIGLYLGEFLW